MKLHFKIISAVAVALVILSGIILSCIEIGCGLDIFKIGDLADFIGRQHIEHVTIDSNHIYLKLKQSALFNADKQKYYDIEYSITKIKELNAYINSNERYKGMRIKVQFGERYDRNNFIEATITVANYSLTGKSDELYEGLYSVKLLNYPMPNDSDYIKDKFWKDAREIQYINSSFLTDIDPLKDLTKLEYLYYETLHYEEEMYAILKEYLPQCEIEWIYLLANQQE